MVWTTVYNLSLDLMGERKADTTFSTTELALVAARAPAMCTLLQAELLPAAGGQTAVPVAALTDRVLLPDQVALSVAPWGLAALLLAESNPSLAAFYQQKYEEARRKIPVKAQRIIDVYGLGG